jgi:hypothetical protein
LGLGRRGSFTASACWGWEGVIRHTVCPRWGWEGVVRHAASPRWGWEGVVRSRRLPVGAGKALFVTRRLPRWGWEGVIRHTACPRWGWEGVVRLTTSAPLGLGRRGSSPASPRWGLGAAVA